MEVTWLGHAAFLLEGDDRVLVDPFLTGNPAAAISAEEVDCDLVCVTHAHADHFGDAIAIASRLDVPLVTIYEISVVAEAQGVEAVGMNVGGSTTVGNTRITMTHAVHSSCFVGNGKVEAGGSPAGFIIDSGARVYHAGDTGVFGDMALIGELYQPELALLPIGDFYTMGLLEATKAAELLAVHRVIPMHYNTFPAIEQDPQAFRASVSEKTRSEVVVLAPGETHGLISQS
jgi:L-ascorbate metabolism protein UlaG (beta-lactamase superfamily)